MITELRTKRANLWNTMESFLDSHRDKNGLLSAADDATYAQMEKEMAEYTNAIKREERRASVEAEMKTPVGQPILSDPAVDTKEAKGRKSAAYNKAFWNYTRSKIPTMLNDLEEGVGSEGGYLVPDEFERRLIEALEEENFIRRYATVIRTSSGDRKIPVVTSKGEASWIDEEGAYQADDDAFGQVTLSAHKLGYIVKVSEELLADSAFDLEAYFTREFARKFGAGEEKALLTGDGSGKPYGLLDDTKGGTSALTAKSATAITADELIDLFYAVKKPYRRNGVWVMADSSIAAIRKLKDGNGNYLWQPGLSEGEPDTILGRPVETSAYMPAIEAEAKPFLFGDLSYFWIADRETRSVIRLNELYAATGQVGFKGYERVDGALTLSEAVKYITMKA